MLFPIRTSYQRRNTPWMNYAIIAINVLLFFGGYNASTQATMSRIMLYMLQPDEPTLVQFISSAFLHANLAHLLGNMVFLWVFGNALNDKLGHWGYLAFYLGGGVIAGVGYLLLSASAPVLGASGAIAAVAGAYLVLLPRTTVTLILWLYVLIPFEVSSLYFILIQFVFDAFMTLYGMTGPGSGGVAYAAHATGYAFGMGIAALLLALGALPRDDYDLLNLIRHRYRRSSYRRMVSGGFDPFSGLRGSTPPKVRRPVKARSVETETHDSSNAAELELRRNINEAASARDLSRAADLYQELWDIADRPVLPRQLQLDVANQLMADQKYPIAAEAYERFAEQYPGYEYLPDIHLMLGVLYGRYLNQPDRAEEYYRRALDRLTDSAKRQMAEMELANLNRRGGGNS